MKRNVNLEEISDGKLYGANDMVKADCNDCKGCSSCCIGMGSSIILDPFDSYQMMKHMQKTFEELIADQVELNVVDGVILPNLKMKGTTERCSFLDNEGRCSIHTFRPGICRLFPLGRYYENHSFQYFLQVHECENKNRTKIKVRKWIATENLKQYEQFILTWHYFILDLQEKVQNLSDDTTIKQINLYVLQTFFIAAYHTIEDFYEQFQKRIEMARERLLCE